MLKLHEPDARATLPCVAGGRVEYSPPYPGLLAAFFSFLLLFATFCYLVLLLTLSATFAYFLPIPTAKRTRLQLTRGPVARTRYQSASTMCGGGRVECSSPYPGLLSTFCYFLLLLPTFAYFCLLFANTNSQTHPPTANLCSSCTRPVPEHLCHVWG